MKRQSEFLMYGVFAGIFFSIVIFIAVFGIVGRYRIFVELTRQSLLKENNRLEIEDGEHVVIITREVPSPSELSIDCDAIRLTNLSGETELEGRLLPPNQEAIIEFTVKNDGGYAKNVEVYWSRSQFPKGLELTRIQDPIAKLGKFGSQLYKVEIIARNMKAQDIILGFYPGEKTSKSVSKEKAKGPVCEFLFTVAE